MVQYFAQQVVRARAEELKAEWCTAIVMDVRDGSILALADSSTMDPGAATIEDAADMTPRAISQSGGARFDREDADFFGAD